MFFSFDQVLVYTVHLAEKGQTRQPIWRSYDDPTYSMNKNRKGQNYFPLIVPWNCFGVMSSNSGDCVLMGKDASGKKSGKPEFSNVKFQSIK